MPVAQTAALPLDELRSQTTASGSITAEAAVGRGPARGWAPSESGYCFRAALAGIIGERREWAALRISLGSIPCKVAASPVTPRTRVAPAGSVQRESQQKYEDAQCAADEDLPQKLLS